MNVKLSFTEEKCNMDINELELSVRSNNCLRRAGINTVGNLIDRFDSLDKIRGFGKGCRIEIKESLLKLGKVCVG